MADRAWTPDAIEAALAGLPRPEFRTRLRRDLERRTEMVTTLDATAVARQTAAPMLRVTDPAAAIDFYTRAFGAREVMRFEAGGRIPHAELAIGNAVILLGSEAPDHGFPSPDRLGGSPVSIRLTVDDPDAAVARAVDAGATIVMPVSDQFYGERTGQVLDPFGYRWSLTKVTEQMSVEEMHRRMAATIDGASAPARPPYVREGFRAVTPYIVVPDAPAIIEFVRAVFDAEETTRAIGGAGGIHAEVRIGDSMVMIGGGAQELSWRGESKPTALHVYVPDVDATFERAVRAGATIDHAPREMEYGERSAGVIDAGGNRWYIATARGTHYVPAGLHDVNVYLHPLRAEPVLAFLARALGATTLEKHATSDGVVHHAKVRIFDSVLEMGEAHGPYQPMSTMFYVYVPDVDAAYASALGAGAQSLTPPADQPYGTRHAGVADPFGNQWYFARPLSVDKH